MLWVSPSQGGSVHIHDRLQVADTLDVSAPANAFPRIPRLWICESRMQPGDGQLCGSRIKKLGRDLALHQRTDASSDVNRVRVRFDTDGYVTRACWQDELEEIAVPHENIP